ncbi:MAG: ATP-binding cassette domain-containing protein [Coriobacteriales bacterium]|jgi:NitT/TauT family transport system permease protein|nr:ATP-binding cassette domain-containing protein [Coriobacteriales bacterium]
MISITTARKLLFKTGVILFWLLVWQLVALLVDNAILLSGPLDTLLALAADAVTVGFWQSIGFSLLRIVLGFLLALSLGTLVALATLRLPHLATVLALPINFIKSTPVVCIIVLLLIWMGSGWLSVAIVALVVFPPAYFTMREEAANVDLRLKQMLAVFSVSWWRRFVTLYWPSALPFLRSSAQVSVGMAWKSGIAAEMIGIAHLSIGEAIYLSKVQLDSAQLFAWTITIVLLSLLCEKTVLALLAHSQNLLTATLRLGVQAKTASNVAVTAPQSSPIQLIGLSKGYEGRTVISDLTFTFEPGGRYCLNSPSGSGKTTLLSLVLGLIMPDQGSVKGAQDISAVFQEPRLFEGRDALQNVLLVCGRQRSRAHCKQLLLELLPPESLTLPVAQLSGGMKRRTELCRALAAVSRCVVLDEPFTGLDEASKRQAIAFIQAHLHGRSLLLATHNAEDAALLGATIIEFS